MINLSASPKIEFVYTSIANYAIQQNRIPLVRKLIIENPFDTDLLDLKIKIKGEPNFINTWEHRIEIIPSHHRVELDVKDLNISASYLSELTEKLSGEIILYIHSREDLIFSKHYNVDLLAYDQ